MTAGEARRQRSLARMTQRETVYGFGTHVVEYAFPEVDGYDVHGWGPIKGPWPLHTCEAYVRGRAVPQAYRVTEAER